MIKRETLGDKRNITVGIRVTAQFKERIEREAAKRGISMTMLIENAVMKFLGERHHV